MIIIFYRTLIMYIVIIAVMRFSGKRQLGELQLSELVVTILISELAAIPMQDTDTPVISGVISIIVLICLEIIVSFLCMKFGPFKKLIDGNSCILIEKGIIDQKQMEKVRFTIDDLMEALRQKGIIDIKDVSIAILESSGKLSVIPENTKTPVTKIMFNKCCTDIPFPITVISDGKILKQGIKKSNLSAHEIKKLLKAQNIASEKRVFYMTVADKQIQTLIKKDPRL